MNDSPDERGLELRELFFETSQELLQALNDEALKLEKKPGDEEIVRVIRRTVHTLKGDSAACGLRELSELAHQFEDALSLEGTATQTAVAEIAFGCADVFTEMIAAYRNDSKMPSTKNLSKQIADLTAAPSEAKIQPPEHKATVKARTSRTGASKTLGGKKAPTKKATTKKAAGKSVTSKSATRKTATRNRYSKSAMTKAVAVRRTAPAKEATKKARSSAKTELWTEYENVAMSKAQAAGQDVYHVVVKIDPHCAMPIAGRQLVHNAIGSVGQIAAVRPDAKSPAASKQVEFVLASLQTVEQISAKGRIPTIAEEVVVELMLAPKAAVKNAAAEAALAEEVPEGEILPEVEANVVPPPPMAAPGVEAGVLTTENILRVEAGRIDNVLNLVGELIIGKSMLQQALI